MPGFIIMEYAHYVKFYVFDGYVNEYMNDTLTWEYAYINYTDVKPTKHKKIEVVWWTVIAAIVGSIAILVCCCHCEL